LAGETMAKRHVLIPEGGLPATVLAPGDPGRRDRLGFALLERRDHRSARAVFLAMLRQDRDNFAARLGVAKAAREAGDRRAALAVSAVGRVMDRFARAADFTG